MASFKTLCMIAVASVQANQAFINDLKKNGSSLACIDIQDNILKATCELSKGSEIAFVPRNQLMTEKELRETEMGKAVLNNERLKMVMQCRYCSALALFFIKEESLGEKSEYHNMIQTIPQAAWDHPVLFDAEDIKTLSNSHFNDYLSAYGEDMYDDYKHLKRVLPEYNDMYDLKKFAFWRLTIANRINATHYPNSLDDHGNDWQFIPLHNMVNHAHDHNLELTSHDGGFKFIATRDIRAGDELTKDFGAGKSDFEHYLNTGTLNWGHEQNPYNYIYVETNYPDGEEHDWKREIFSADNDHKIIDPKFHDTFNDSQKRNWQSYIQSKRLASYQGDKKQFQKDMIKHILLPSSKETETKVWKMIHEDSEAQLVKFEHTLDEYQQFIDGTGFLQDPKHQTEKFKNVMKIRMSERIILENVQYTSQKIVDIMSTDDQIQKDKIYKEAETTHGINIVHFMNDHVFHLHVTHSNIPGVKDEL